MRIHLPAATLLAAALLGATPAPAPKPSLPPEIIHLQTRRICSVLHDTIAPAIGMMLQNDKTIAKSPDLFKQYNFAMGYGSSASQDMSVMRMENLVGPLADNVVAIERQLDDANSFPAVPHSDDDKHLLQLRAELQQVLATQEAALDIINGFVTTQQLSEMQHEGFGYISAINGTDTTNGGSNGGGNGMGGNMNTPFMGTPPPGMQDTPATLSNAGLPSNPYEIDVARLPGLTLGYNPVTHLRDGVIWTQGEASKKEDTLSKDVIATAQSCGGQTTVVPQASPTP